MTEINLGFCSGIVDTPPEPRQGAWGNSLEVTLRHFVRAYTDAAGVPKTVEHTFKFQCNTSERRVNPLFPEVQAIAVGDWVHLQYEMDQSHYKDKVTGEPKTFDKRTITKIVGIAKGHGGGQAVPPTPTTPQGGVTPWTPPAPPAGVPF